MCPHAETSRHSAEEGEEQTQEGVHPVPGAVQGRRERSHHRQPHLQPTHRTQQQRVRPQQCQVRNTASQEVEGDGTRVNGGTPFGRRSARGRLLLRRGGGGRKLAKTWPRGRSIPAPRSPRRASRRPITYAKFISHITETNRVL